MTQVKTPKTALITGVTGQDGAYLADGEQELEACVQPDESQKPGLDLMLKDMEALLARMG